MLIYLLIKDTIMIITESLEVSNIIRKMKFNDVPKGTILSKYIKMAEFVAKSMEFKFPGIKWFNVIPSNFSTISNEIFYFNTKKLKVTEAVVLNYLNKLSTIGKYTDADLDLFLGNLIFPVDVIAN